ncbi:hypothetical protein FQA39_LY11036 [Lamprigera yunnana]|nr:hypothetical protein FQA39_LY11036 [Lamprigera yunnana]
MRFIVILFATVSLVVVNAKFENEDKRQKKSTINVDNVKIKNTNFKWNKNFKNHKNNIYDVDKKSTESVYKSNYKKEENLKRRQYIPRKYEKLEEVKQGSYESKSYNKKEDKLKAKRPKIKLNVASNESIDVSTEEVGEPKFDSECDTLENTCEAPF